MRVCVRVYNCVCVCKCLHLRVQEIIFLEAAMNIQTGKTLQLLLGHDNQRFNLQSSISDVRTISLEKMKISDKNYKNSKFLCGHRKGHSPFSTPIGSVCTLLFVVTSAHTAVQS